MLREPSPRQRVAAEAARIVESVRVTGYSHVPIVIPPTGTYELDSVGFLAYVLRGVAPDHYAQLPEYSRRCLQAFEVFSYLESLVYDTTNGWRRQYTVDGALVFEPSQGWARVEEVADLRRGDVLAWEMPTSRSGAAPGHVAIVAGKPRRLGTALLAVRVYDSSEAPHFEDSRRREGVFGGGVGVGWILFRLDATGAPEAVRFGPRDGLRPLPVIGGRLKRIADRRGVSVQTRAA